MESGEIMYARILLIGTVITVGILQAQTVDLRGRVMSGGAPVADATVDLKLKGTTTKTGADGTCSLGTVALAPMGGPALDYHLDAGFLSLKIDNREDLRLEIFANDGRLQGSIDRNLEAGSHRIALADFMPAGARTGLYFLRMRIGGESFAHPFFHSGTGSSGTVFAPALRVASAKRAVVVDTLLVKKTGYQDLAKEITSYTAGNLGDLTLTATSSDGWVNLFNGKDLTGWTPLIHLSKVGVNTDSTFRPDLENNGIRVSYDKLTGSFGGDQCKCGLLYYNKPLTNYRIRVTYRFFDPTVSNAPSWGKNNSGLMIFGIDPTKVTGDPIYPPIIEIQILGTPSGGGSTNANECEMRQFVNPTVTATHTGTCGNNKDSKAPGSGKTAPAAGVWTTLEADVHITGDTKVYQWPDTTNAVLIMSKPMYGTQAVTSGYLAIQSEGQPIVFKDILLKELPQ